MDWGPFRARATVKAVSAGEPGRGEEGGTSVFRGGERGKETHPGVIRGDGGQKPVTGRGCQRSVPCCTHSFIQIGG